MMKVIKYGFLQPDEPFQDASFDNWSRRYEWGYILNFLKSSGRKTSIHNTCCGSGPLHLSFLMSLENYGFVTNSDLRRGECTNKIPGFFLHNVLDPWPGSFNLVLCVSTLEELGGPDDIKRAYTNLCEQVLPGGDLIITCDYPDVDTDVLDDLVGRKVEDVPVRLNGSNSTRTQPEFSHLNIVLLHVKDVP
jgi:hypothetical protein